jgi:hypothetical protein
VIAGDTAGQRTSPGNKSAKHGTISHQPGSAPPTPCANWKDHLSMTLLWVLLAIVYVVCWVFLGLSTFRKGHYWLFWIGFFFPILWIVGALIAPTERAAARLAAIP